MIPVTNEKKHLKEIGRIDAKKRENADIMSYELSTGNDVKPVGPKHGPDN